MEWNDNDAIIIWNVYYNMYSTIVVETIGKMCTGSALLSSRLL